MICRSRLNRFQKGLQFWKGWFEGFIFCFVMHQTFLLLDPENGAQMDLPLSVRYINSGFRFSCKILNLASDTQIYTDIRLDGLCIITAKNVISYFRSATNRVHATTTVADFAVTKQLFWKILETAQTSNITQRFALPHRLVGFLVSISHQMNTLKCCITWGFLNTELRIKKPC